MTAPRRSLLAGCIFLSASVAGCGGGVEHVVPTGSKVPDVVLAGIDRPEVRLSELQGRVVVLNVWATWCPPCRAEMPSLQRLSDRLDPDRYAVVALSVDEDVNLVREFVLKLGLRLPVYLDSGSKVSTSVLGVRSYPQTFLIDPSGRLVEQVIGELDWGSADAVSRVTRAAGGGQG